MSEKPGEIEVMTLEQMQQRINNPIVQKPTRSLVKKLAEVMGAVGWIQKTGYNEFHKYRYAQEADLVNAIRGELSKRNVMVFPNVITCDRKPHEVETMKWDDREKAKVPTIRKTQLTEIVVEWTFVDGESGEERKLLIPGVGEDNVDKGFYKAFTGSEKYALMKTFLIPTGDDPEKDSDDERDTAKQQGKVDAQEMGKKKAEDLRAKKAQADPAKGPDQLVCYPSDDGYEVTGMPEVMNDHRELLLKYGKRLYVDGKPGKTIYMDALSLDSFKHEFCDNRGGIMTSLKAKKVADAAKELASGQTRQ